MKSVKSQNEDRKPLVPVSPITTVQTETIKNVNEELEELEDSEDPYDSLDIEFKEWTPTMDFNKESKEKKQELKSSWEEEDLTDIPPVKQKEEVFEDPVA